MAGTSTEQTREFQISLSQNEKLKKSVVKELIQSILSEELSQFVYDSDTAGKKANSLAEKIINKLNELSLKRYKYVANVVLGEQRGGGIKVGARCLWDTDTDDTVSHSYIAETFFCSVAVFGVFFY